MAVAAHHFARSQVRALTPLVFGAFALSTGLLIAWEINPGFLHVLVAWARAEPLRAAALSGALLASIGSLYVAVCRALRSANAEFKSLIDSAVDAILIIDPKTLRILYANRVAAECLGVSRRGAYTLGLQDVLETHGQSISQLNARLADSRPLAMKMFRRRREEATIDVEVRLSTPVLRGHSVWAYTLRDVSLQKQGEQQLIENQSRLESIATHDQLTGLPNRHYMSTFLPDAIARAKTAGSMLGILFIDLDHFKLINDTQGHENGDKLLRVVGRRLRDCVRQTDVVVRMGGDEFVIVLADVKSYEEITHSAHRVIESLGAPVVVDDRHLQTSASIGISVFPRDGADLTALLKHSDTAMYQAKDQGRNTVQTFTPLMDRKLKRRVTIETMLRQAMRERQLEVYYQPFINLSTRAVVGLEALIRWRHPVRGMIPADSFIGVAEETGLIVPIGDFVLQRTLTDMAAWRSAGATLVPVSLNVAPAQLLRGDFKSTVARSLLQHAIVPALLQIEMTERAIFDIRAPQQGERRHDSIAGLRDLGIKIAIDDFGTGYSSLAYLKNWRVDTLKIDKGFIRDLASDSSDYAIVSAIIAMARHLRIEVVAEGIEGYQQDDILRTLGCHQGQGYLYARPMSAEKALAMLGRRFSDATYDHEDSMPVMALAAD
jgi:diguanylate cyclase (GGDEF)-like protein/PAS domain S-box-containing protein